MKKVLFAFALVVLCTVGCREKRVSLEPVAKPDFFKDSAYFEAKNSLYEELPIYQDNIVLVGDDYIDCGLWSEFYADTTLKNRGINFDATAHVLYRIDNIAAQKPAKIFVSAGYYDIVFGVEKDVTIANIKAIFERASKLSPETELYYLNIVGNGQAKEKAAVLNEAVKALSAEGLFTYIDINEKLADGIAKGKYSWDGGVYLNGAGYEALAGCLDQYIGKTHINKSADKKYKKEISDYYKHRVSVFQSIPVEERPIVMLGDDFVSNALWSELIPMGKIINRGIIGDVAEGVSRRLDEIAAYKPEIVYLMTGMNNFADDPQISVMDVWKEYESLIKNIIAKMPTTLLVVQSILPVNKDARFYEGFNEKAAALDKLIEASKGTYGYIYLDVASALSDENGDLNSLYSEDGIHLNAAGNFIWTSNILKLYGLSLL